MQQRKNKTENLKSTKPEKENKETHTNIVITKPKTGENQYNKKFEETGPISSFEKSFTASAKGCKIPPPPSLLGPFRS